MVSSDFKRIKAKVGKRAPKKLNDTETNFQSTSLHVRKQVVNIHDENSSGEKGGKGDEPRNQVVEEDVVVNGEQVSHGSAP